ncbi:MAG: hypothetical protein GY884_00045 [Proteobacteria bacterium]|nr:hypothetical protein [Pseudomonadota bacterium]
MDVPKTPLRVAVYSLLAAVVTWPAVLHPSALVPGAGRTDLWNSLWSMWFVQESLFAGELPYRTELLGFPSGGVLVPADLLNAVLFLPITATLGPSVAYTAVVFAHLVFAGLAADALARHVFRSEPPGWVAGASFLVAPVLLSGVHNGTSEAFGGGWLALAVLLSLRAAEVGGWKRVVGAGLGLGLATVSSFYLGLAAWFFWGALLVLGARGETWLGSARRTALVGVIGLGLALPFAAALHAGSSARDNLVGIKGERELNSVRRSIGPADARGWFIPGDWRSPDFRSLSRYGEEFIHCHYLGWGLILLAAGGLVVRRKEKGERGVLLLGGATGFALAMGPVVAMDGSPVLLEGNLGIPLPYFVVERLPGFSSLSLLYRLAAGPALALSVLAGGLFASSRWGRLAPVAALLLVAELRFASPVAGLPDTEPTEVSEPIEWLREAPDGAVMNFPVVGGRGYLFEQTVHAKPLAGTLNFPNNRAGMKVWAALLEATEAGLEPAEFKAKVGHVARKEGIRYVVVHVDPMARPDMHDEAVRALKTAVPAASEEPGVRVHALW